MSFVTIMAYSSLQDNQFLLYGTNECTIESGMGSIATLLSVEDIPTC
jgi:hypothetical protein